jgi:hypothetical protein
VFTKLDALDDLAFEDLCEKGISPKDAESQCEMHSMVLLKQKGILDKLSKSKFPPKHTVFLRSMKSLLLSYLAPMHITLDLDNPTSSIDSLLEVTASALNDGALQQLFVTSQLSNLKLSVRYSIADNYLYVIFLP